MIQSTYPRWLEEPAKLVGWVVMGTIAVCGAILALANEIGVLLPDSWQDEVRVAVATVTTVSLIATRIQALLTRNGAIGKISVGGSEFQGVYSPATIQRAGAPAPCAIVPPDPEA
ncbi:MAG: hypothetical protein FJ038_04330 [Chloroflexi bacterium]|nr:hypothetical protein [Chloroflexota bacterium]